MRLVKFVSVSLIALFLTQLLSGCGFHLRGYGAAEQAQFQSVKLTSIERVHGEIREALVQQLKGSGVRLSDSLREAELDIRFEPTVYKQSRTAYTGSGDAASLLLTMTQRFTVNRVADERQLLAAEVRSVRDHQVDNAALLASNREMQDIRRQMAQDVARQVIQRINRALMKRESNAPAGKTGESAL